MRRRVEVKKADSQRDVSPSAVSSGDRGRPIAGLVEKIEKAGIASKVGLSSAALRAGDLVRGMRKEVGLSQSQLANMIGVKQSRISEIEAGVGSQGPTWDVMERVANACGRNLKPVLIDAQDKFREAAQEYFKDSNLTFEPGTKEAALVLEAATVQIAEIAGRKCLFVDLQGSAKQAPVHEFPEAIAFIKS